MSSTTTVAGELLPAEWLQTHRQLAVALVELPITRDTLPELVPCFGASLALLVRDLRVAQLLRAIE